MEPINSAELLSRLAQLTNRVERLEAALAAQATTRWRRIPKGAVIALIGIAILGGGIAAADVSGRVLQQFMDLSKPPVTVPPLDTFVMWGRRDPPAELGQTNQILSLIAEANQQNSLTWPLYIQLSGTNHPGATMDSSQSVGATVRAFNRSTGNPWLAGFHSEIFHGRDGLTGPPVDAHGTSILFNGELTTLTSSGGTVGLNLQNTSNSTVRGTHAINIQSGSASAIWQNGIHFEGTGIAGNIGINFDNAHYNMGIDLSDNSIRMNANQKVVLERNGTIFLWYNLDSGQVELVKGGSVVASW